MSRPDSLNCTGRQQAVAEADALLMGQLQWRTLAISHDTDSDWISACAQCYGSADFSAVPEDATLSGHDDHRAGHKALRVRANLELGMLHVYS